MAHPFQQHKQNKVEHARVAHITSGYASGGAVPGGGGMKASGARSANPSALKVGGGPSTVRQDRPGRARGGRAPKSKGTNVNVIVAPSQPSGAPPMPPIPPPGLAGPPPAMAGPPMPPPRPPMPPAMPPPGMPPRSVGGRAYAKGGAVFAEGRRNGTQVTHSPNKKDGKDIGRGKVVTYATGGPIGSEHGKMGPNFGSGARGGLSRIAKAKRAAKTYARP